MEQLYSSKIDVFTHILPPKYDEALTKKTKSTDNKQGKTSIINLDDRFRLLDKLGGLKQVLTIAQPPLETVVNAQDAVELAKLANDSCEGFTSAYMRMIKTE